ncbi:dynamin family protein [Actinosynnema sp. NPDC059797]
MTTTQLIAWHCEQLLAEDRLSGDPVLRDVVAQCRQPLRVLLVGDVSSGKSTLLNALIGHHLAAVAYQEMTSSVTWYHHPDLAETTFADPAHHSVAVDFPLADRLVLGDTPGLNTTSDNPLETGRLLGGADLAGGASAYVYLVAGASAEVWVDQLTRLGAISAGPLDLVGNIVLVTAKIDTVDDDLAAVEQRARADAPTTIRFAAVNQRMAMAARTGAVDHRVATALSHLKRRPELLEPSRLSWEVLRDEAGLPSGHVAALEECVGTPASLPNLVREATELISPADVVKLLERFSRIRDLEAVLADLAEDTELFTATATMHRLNRLAARRPEARSLVRLRLAQVTDSLEFTALHRRAAARLLRHTDMASALSHAERTDTVALLIDGACHDASTLIASWEELGGDPASDSQTRRVAALVIDLARRFRPVERKRGA